jgi:hypothetical protein
MDRLGVEDLGDADRRIARSCAQHGIPCLTLAPPFLEAAERTSVYLHGFGNAIWGVGHWNEAGHQLAANLIAERIVGIGSSADSKSDLDGL